MLRPPSVISAGRTIHGPLHIAIERCFGATRTLASPHMLSAMVDFIVEAVVNSDVCVGQAVDSIHVALELVAVFAAVFEVASQVQIGVDHFVEKGLD